MQMMIISSKEEEKEEGKAVGNVSSYVDQYEAHGGQRTVVERGFSRYIHN